MRTSKIIWKNEINKIEKLIKLNVNMRTIAVEYGVTFQRLYQVCKDHGISIEEHLVRRREKKLKERLAEKERQKNISAEEHRKWYMKYWSDLHNKKPRKKNYHNQPIDGVDPKVLEARRRTQKYNEKHKLETLCRRICGHAISRGWLIKGVCSVCGCLELVEAHHEDYYHPFQVIWVCRHHHHQLYHSGSRHHRSK